MFRMCTSLHGNAHEIVTFAHSSSCFLETAYFCKTPMELLVLFFFFFFFFCLFLMFVTIFWYFHYFFLFPIITKTPNTAYDTAIFEVYKHTAIHCINQLAFVRHVLLYKPAVVSSFRRFRFISKKKKKKRQNTQKYYWINIERREGENFWTCSWKQGRSQDHTEVLPPTVTRPSRTF